MAKHLDWRQRNNLRIGNTLAAEIPASKESRRAFIMVAPYHTATSPKDALTDLARRRPFSKVLNDAADDHDVCYSVAVLEVEKAALEAYLGDAYVSYSARLETIVRSDRSDLTTIEEVEAELLQHLGDLARLDIRWRVVPWS